MLKYYKTFKIIYKFQNQWELVIQKKKNSQEA